jgi:GT2 family glycosyltransferase
LERTTATDCVLLDVIVVDDGGGGVNQDIARSHDTFHVRVVSLPHNAGQSAAHAAGLAIASTEVVAFLDDDAVVTPGWLRAIVSFFDAYPDMQAVGGRIEPLQPARLMDRLRQQIHERRRRAFTDPAFRAELVDRYGLRGASAPHLADHMSGCNFAMRRGARLALRARGVSIGRGADRELSAGLLAAGVAIGYEPAMVVHHRHFHGYRALLSTCLQEGRRKARSHSALSPLERVRLALSRLVTAPFHIRAAPHMWAADRRRVRVYTAYTLIQLCEAVGELTDTLRPKGWPL